MNIYESLKTIVGDHVVSAKEDKIPYQRDASYFVGDEPEFIVMPGTTLELSKVLELCNENRIGVVVRGGGSSLTGACIPKGKTIVISMLRFDKIVETKLEDRYVVVESGVRIEDLNNYLSSFGYFYPPDPASSVVATVGGTINTNAGGLRGVMYGVTKEWILGLEVVLPDGSILNFGGRALKKSLGYDLTSIIIGSEGSLGIITKAILKIWPMPEVTGRILAYFKDIESIGQAVASVKKSGITPYLAEFMDGGSIRTIKADYGLEFTDDTNYMLMIDVASSKLALESDLERTVEILKRLNPLETTVIRDKAISERLLMARKGLYPILLKQRKAKSEYLVIGDVVVPVSAIPAAMQDIDKSIKKHNLQVYLYGHIGDGNIHANIFADPENEEVMKRVDSFQMDIAMIAVKLGGSVSAEHGIGIEKKNLIKMEMDAISSSKNLELMKLIKHVFDPNGILNRGKIFDE